MPTTNHLTRINFISGDLHRMNAELYEANFDDSGDVLSMEEAEIPVCSQCERMIKYLQDIIDDFKKD
jgi:hypothetical protein